jgi:hypothetical protein
MTADDLVQVAGRAYVYFPRVFDLEEVQRA